MDLNEPERAGPLDYSPDPTARVTGAFIYALVWTLGLISWAAWLFLLVALLTRTPG